MNQELNTEDIGEQFGDECAASILRRAAAYCAHEVQRIALVNEPGIIALRAESALLVREDQDLGEALRHAPRVTDVPRRPYRTLYSWGVTLILTFAGFVFSLMAFDPYRMGWKRYLYCVGIAVVTPYLVDKMLHEWNARKLVKSFVTVAFIAALTSLVLLAVIRGDLLAQEFNAVAAAVIVDDAPPSESNADFYASTLLLLRVIMALLALAMELAAGLALRDAWQQGGNLGTGWEQLRERRTLIGRRMLALADEITTLKNEPEIFAARFWRNFHRAMVTHTFRGTMTKLVLFAVVMFGGLHLHAAAEEHTTIIVALDLSQSVGSAGPDRQTNFHKNIDGVTRLLAQAPASSRIVILGITDKSFAEPFILLSAHVQDDPGYFGERLKNARSALMREWRRRSKELAPRFPYTDILGAMLLAKQIFDGSPNAGRNVLVIFSDMRHHTRDLDLESGQSVLNSALRKQSTMTSLALLQGVEVYALGVDGTGKSTAYWQSLQTFWTEYFHNAGATLRRYSVLRELPAMGK